MRITPGPLELEPNSRGDGIWLMQPGKRTFAVATVWRGTNSERLAEAEGNAIAMAYAGALYDLAETLCLVKTKADLEKVITEATRDRRSRISLRRLTGEMREKAEAHPVKPRMHCMDSL